MSLWSLANSVQFSSTSGINGLDNVQNDEGEFAWQWYWQLISIWEAKATAQWNVSDVVDPLTNETTHLRFNPVLDGYAYFDINFVWSPTTNTGIAIQAYVQPLQAYFLDLDVWKSVNYPKFWTSENNENQVGNCVGLKSVIKPPRVQVDIALAYPTCQWSLEKFFTWEDPLDGAASTSFVRRLEATAFECESKTYGGWNSGIRPFWDDTFFNFWQDEVEWKPFICEIKRDETGYIVPQAQFCDVKTDKQCIIGCNPADNNPDCLPNPNYVEPETAP